MHLKSIGSLSHVQLILILLALSFVLLMLGNGALSLTHPDEVFYIQTAKEMIAKNSWATPYIFDEPQFEKPILSYWFFIISLKLFGLNPFAARFAPALFGILTVVLVYWVGWLLFKNKRLAFLSGLVIMSTAIQLALSRSVLTDMIFSFWVVLSIVLFYWAYTTPKKKEQGLILSGAAVGISVLAKGLLGICFSAGTVLIFLLLQKDFKFLRSKALWIGILVFLAIALPWHLLMYKLYGPMFLQEYFQNVHVRRLFVAEHDMSNTWYFYLGTVFGGMMPWSFFLIPAVVLFFKDVRKNGKEGMPFRFLLAWTIAIFVFVQPAQSKLASYILPVFPAVVLMLGWFFEQALFSEKSSGLRRNFTIAAVLIALLLMSAPLAVKFLTVKFKSYVPVLLPEFSVAFLMSAIGIFIIVSLFLKKFSNVVLALPGIPAIIVLAVSLLNQYAEPWVSCEQISSKLEAADSTRSVVLSSKLYVRGVRYYTDRPMAVMDIAGEPFFSPHPIPFLDSLPKVEEFLKTQRKTTAIVKMSDLEYLRMLDSNKWSLNEREVIGGKYLVEIERLKK